MSTDLVLNKNFYNYVGAVLFGGFANNKVASIGTSYSSGSGYYSGSDSSILSQMKTTGDANSVSLYYGTYASASSYWNQSFFRFGTNSSGDIYFTGGSGTDAATVNDIALISPNANISTQLISGERDSYTSILYTVKFSVASGQQAELCEVGLMRDIFTNISNTNTYHTFLLGRCKLDSSIALNDNNPSVTVQIRLALPIPA